HETACPLRLSIFNRANPSHPGNAETGDRLCRGPATTRRFVRGSTTLCRQSAQTDNDKVALECNEAVRRERDCSRGARACLDRYAEVSRQNVASTDIRRVKPSQRTRFASRFAVDTARRTA